MNIATHATEWASASTDLLDDIRKARESILKETGLRRPFDRIACTQAFFDRLAAWIDALMMKETANAPLTAMLMGNPLVVRPDAEVHPRGWQPERQRKSGEWEVVPV